MPFESQWARIPLAIRWGVCLVVAVVLIALLVRFVSHHNGNGEVPVSAKKFKLERDQAQVLIGQEQAPVRVRLPAGTAATTALAAAVRHDMRRQIDHATIDGPLQRVHCVVHGGTLARTGYHCTAEAAHVHYPFLAVVSPKAHRAFFCEKVYPPSPSENIPVSKRCRT